MFANLLTLLILFAYMRLVIGETTKEPIKDMQLRSTLNPNGDYIPTPDTWDVNQISHLKSLLAYHPSIPQSVKVPFAVTRLAKSHSFGFDPYFNKEYFAPFERRQRPVTLVAFRKNGWLANEVVQAEDVKDLGSSEVAELQSPYNDISSFWHDEMTLTKK